MTQSKYDPNKNGNTEITHKIYDENGVFFLLGNGCEHHKDCLSCPFPDCIWESGSNSKDMKRRERCTT